MKKKALSLFLILTIMMGCSVFTRADSPISVFLDGKQIQFDTQPTIIDGRTMVPLRAIFEALNAKVSWNDSTKTVVASRDSVLVSVTVDVPVLTKNGEEIPLDAPPKIINGRTLVPVRAVAESFDADVSWDGETRSVKIFTSKLMTEADNNTTTKPHAEFDEYMENIDSKIKTGGDFVALIKPDNTLWMWGANSKKQISDTLASSVNTPHKIMDNVNEVSLGDSHTLAVTAGGYLYAWGNNENGQIGNSDGKNPVMKSVVSTDAAANHSIVLTENGDVYGCGRNDQGQLGESLPKNISEFQLICSNAKKVFTEKDYSVILNKDETADIVGNVNVFLTLPHNKKYPAEKISGKHYKISNVSDIETYENAIIIYSNDNNTYKYLRGNNTKERFKSALPPENIEFSSDSLEYVENGVLFMTLKKGGLPIIDDVHYCVKSGNNTYIIVLEDCSICSLNNSYIKDHDNQIKSVEIYSEKIVFNSLFPHNVKTNSILMELDEVILDQKTCKLSLKFKDSSGNVIQPVGFVNIDLTDSDLGFSLGSKTSLLSYSDYHDGVTKLLIQVNDFTNTIKGNADVTITFSDIDSIVSCQQDSVPGFVTVSPGDRISFTKGKIADLQLILNTIMSEKNIEVIVNGEITYTYDVNKANEIRERIEKCEHYISSIGGN